MNSDRNFVRSLSEYLAFHTEQSSDHFSHLIDSFLQGRPPHSKPAQAEQNRLKGRLDAEIQTQNGVPSFLQTYLITHLQHGSWPPQASFVATRYLHRSAERFVSWDRRQSFVAELNGEPIRGTELGFRQLLYSQGAESIFRWGSIPCFKAIYDLGIYAMLIAELQPGTLIELGSGAGGSAVFFADLCASSGLTTEILSVDRALVEVSDPRVAFIQSDCAEWLSAAVKSKREFRRPCLLIEDFHGDLGGFFEQIDAILEVGDYLIIEDSSPKQNRISEVITNRPYLIDSKFTDLFGINCTSAINSIFVKQGDDGAPSAPARQDRQLLREQDRAWRRRSNR